MSIAITPSGEAGTLQILLDGREIFNRQALPTDGSGVPDPKLIKTLGAELRGKVLAALDKAPATAAH
ncbi:MAG: hypothetical protein NVSMB2_08200 [Chloroflexota bacterium]